MTASTNPSAGRTERLALFADCLLVGVLTSLCSLPLLTAPAAFATACTVLRGAADDRADARPGSYLRLLTERLRTRPAGEAAAGAVFTAGLLLFTVDLLLTRTGLPGGAWCAGPLAAAALLAVGVALRAAATADNPGTAEPATWAAALRAAAGSSRTDPGGTVLLASGAAVCAVTAWTLPPLAPVAPGLLAFAAVATEARPRARAIRSNPAEQAR